jgi:eukaryotic-like serine/threonine-protein kinase
MFRVRFRPVETGTHKTMAFRRRPPQREPGPVPPDEQVTLVEGAPLPPPPPDLPPEGPPREPDRYLWPWLALLLVLLAVGGGLIAYFATRGDDDDKKVVKVPQVVGFTEQAAVTRVRRAGLDPNVSRTFSSKPAGLVVDQNPEPGATLAKGRVVSLTISNGPSAIAVPNLVSLSEADAIAALTKAGLRADVFQIPNNQKAGTVVAQRPTAGEKVARGSSVRLNVSKGPTQTTTVVTTAPTVTTTRTATSTITTVTTTTPTVTTPTVITTP